MMRRRMREGSRVEGGLGDVCEMLFARELAVVLQGLWTIYTC